MLKNLSKFCKSTIKQYPHLKADICDIYIIARDEIEDEGSEDHECELAMDAIEDLINRRGGRMIDKLPTLYKRTELGQIQEWTMCVDGANYYSIEGIKGGTLTTNKPTASKGKNTGKANATSDTEQALKEAKAKWQKKLDKGYSQDINKVDTALTYFKPMLCEDYNDYKDRVDFSKLVSAQPKLDGQRCIARADGLWSRNGKPILSTPHIHNALKEYFNEDPNLIIDGELYCDKLKNDFEKIMHLCRKTKPSIKDLEESATTIQYWVYDIPSVKANFSTRSDTLHKLFDTSTLRNINKINLKSWPIVLVPTVLVTNQKQMDEWYEKWVEAGMEGQIIRLDTPYENKRSRNIFKRKEFKTEECEIVDIGEGVGNRIGTAGFMVLKLKDGRTFNSNIKGSHKFLTSIFKDSKKYIGKSATCKYFNLTKYGIPRFPFVIDLDRERYE